jgi:CBS-domain-containing membrane protein
MVVPTVRDVMSGTVVSVREDAGYREIIGALVDNEVADAAVVDAAGRVLGVVSEADLMPKVGQYDEGVAPGKVDPRRWRGAGRQAVDNTARELMSSPAVTIGPEASIADAAWLMDTAQVEQLPVVDESRRLIGRVSRHDVLRESLRSDPAVRDELAGPVLRRVLALRAPQVRVGVSDGVVTLTGSTDRRSTAQLVRGLAYAVPGVVDVVDRLQYEYDDTETVPRPRPMSERTMILPSWPRNRSDREEAASAT